VLCAFDHTYFLQSGDEDDGFHQVGFFSPFSLLSLTLLSFQTCMVPHYRLNIEAWLQETKDRGLLAVDDLEQGANFECAACPPFLPFFRSTALTRISRTGGSKSNASAKTSPGHFPPLPVLSEPTSAGCFKRRTRAISTPLVRALTLSLSLCTALTNTPFSQSPTLASSRNEVVE
jgi:hypothetical protein